MERKRYILLIFCLLQIGLVSGQNSRSIYDAYRTSDMVSWGRVIDLMESEPDKTNAFRLELINYHYGYIAWCIDINKKKDAEKYLKLAERHVIVLEDAGYNLPKIYAYKAAFVGYKIGISPIRAPFIGMESIKFADKSIISDPNNALGYIQLANIKYYMPSAMGGSKEEAIKNYLLALQIMENGSEIIEQNWNYLNLLATIINGYKEIGDLSTAEEYCIKALKIEPDFFWVKNELYPEILKSYRNE